MQLLILFSLLAAAFATNWAIIAAGSNSYSNYRHQADVSHAWQMLKAHGYDDAHIITMMYDDIANNAQNPFKGNIINHLNGPNVYPGAANIDYPGAQCSAKNFLKVLSGDVSAGHKVVNSGPKDNIFVFYSDHGTTGYVCFPSDNLYAKDLIATIQDMYSKNKYHEMIFYIEACESGSMFDGILPPNVNVYATTASNPTESSWACYYDSTRRAYLGDTYSVNFLEDSDIADFKKETFADQYVIIRDKTNSSHVMQYGQLSMAKEKLHQFLDGDKTLRLPVQPVTDLPTEQVLQRDADIAVLQHQLEVTSDGTAEHEEILREINRLLVERIKYDRRMKALVSMVSGDPALFDYAPRRIYDHNCFKEAHIFVETVCGSMSSGALGYHARKIANLCNAGYTVQQISDAAVKVCGDN